MKICGSCKGKGVVNYEICDDCGGDGLDPRTTMTQGRTQRRKSADIEFDQKEKKVKFDKKNATRLI